MVKELLTPDYIFEASWEVCNKVGGIYTVLSTRANTLQTKFRDKVFFVGPDFWQGKENPLFIESDNLCAAWKKYAIEKEGISKLKLACCLFLFRHGLHGKHRFSLFFFRIIP